MTHDNMESRMGNYSYFDMAFHMDWNGNFTQMSGVVDNATQFEQEDLGPSYLHRYLGHQCLGQIGSCFQGLTLSLWLKLDESLWSAELDISYTIVAAMSGDFDQGFHMYTTRRNASIEIRNAINSKTRYSYFPVPIGRWFHFAFTWMPEEWPNIFINSFQIKSQNMLEYSWYILPPESNQSLWISWSPVASNRTRPTPMALDDVYIIEKFAENTTIIELYSKGKVHFEVDFNDQSKGVVSFDELGNPSKIHGRRGQGVSLDMNSYLVSKVPFYLGCFGSPRGCREGFTMSLWVFIRPQSNEGSILEAVNEREGISLYISNISNSGAQLIANIYDLKANYSIDFQTPVREWVFLAISWTPSVQSLYVINNGSVNINSNWSSINVTQYKLEDMDSYYPEDRDIYLTLGGGKINTNVALDELYFKEWILNDAEIWGEYGKVFKDYS